MKRPKVDIPLQHFKGLGYTLSGKPEEPAAVQKRAEANNSDVHIRARKEAEHRAK